MNELSYIKSNFYLICNEFNTTDQTRQHPNHNDYDIALGSAQWTRAKYLSVRAILDRTNPEKELARFETLLAKSRALAALPPAQYQMPDHEDRLYCKYCNEAKIADEFRLDSRYPSGRLHICKRCDRFDVLRFLSRMVAKKRTEKHECSITVDDVIAQIRKQSAVAFSSGLPISFASKTEWQCTLERSDNNVGTLSV
jgi:hypothetical protein